MIGKSLTDSEDFSTYSLDFVAEWVVSSSHRHWIADWIDHGVSDRPRPRTVALSFSFSDVKESQSQRKQVVARPQ